jgi:hypothetical protein
MLHPREFTLCNVRKSAEDMFSDKQTKHRVANELESLIVKFSRLVLMSGRYLLVSP